jgi:hypothetical protein
MARIPKYQEVKRLGEHGIQLVQKLDTELKHLVASSYTVTTNGGANILWRVNLPKTEGGGIKYTISTESLSKKHVNSFIVVNIYRHYILNQEGLSYVQFKLLDTLL